MMSLVGKQSKCLEISSLPHVTPRALETPKPACWSSNRDRSATLTTTHSGWSPAQVEHVCLIEACIQLSSSCSWRLSGAGTSDEQPASQMMTQRVKRLTLSSLYALRQYKPALCRNLLPASSPISTAISRPMEMISSVAVQAYRSPISQSGCGASSFEQHDSLTAWLIGGKPQVCSMLEDTSFF